MSWSTDPVGFCRDVLGFEAWSKQAEILEAVRDHERVAVRSANATGKTAAAACAALWWLSGGPGSVVVTTAPTERQVRKVLWREIARRHGEARSFFDGAQLSDTELLLAPDWFAIGLTADSAESFQGWHARRLLVIADEASGIEEPIFEAIDGVLAGGDGRLLLISNPTRTSGAFFDAFHDSADLWHRIVISALDCPAITGEPVSKQAAKGLVSRRWVETQTRKWGERSPLHEIRVLGCFPSQADDSVVSAAELEAARLRTLEPGLPLVVAVDVARFGMDETVIAVRRGDVVRIAASYIGKDTMQTVGAILRVARDLEREHSRRPAIVIDDVGVGGGVTDRLNELGEFRVVAYNGARRARHSSDYPNARCEDWFALADLLPALDLDSDQFVAADLLAPRYSIDSQGRRVVEPKAQTKTRLRRSPDRADAIVMAFAIDRSRGQILSTHVPRLTFADIARQRAYQRPALTVAADGQPVAHAPTGVLTRNTGARVVRDRLGDQLAALGIDRYDSRRATL